MRVNQTVHKQIPECSCLTNNKFSELSLFLQGAPGIAVPHSELPTGTQRLQFAAYNNR